MSAFVTRNLNSLQMRHCYIIELVYKVFSFRTSTRMSGRRHLSSTQDLQTVGDEFDAIS